MESSTDKIQAEMNMYKEVNSFTFPKRSDADKFHIRATIVTATMVRLNSIW